MAGPEGAAITRLPTRLSPSRTRTRRPGRTSVQLQRGPDDAGELTSLENSVTIKTTKRFHAESLTGFHYLS